MEVLLPRKHNQTAISKILFDSSFCELIFLIKTSDTYMKKHEIK